VIVIEAEPDFTAVTIPLEFTVATVGTEESQVILLYSAPAGNTVVDICLVLPTFIVRDPGEAKRLTTGFVTVRDDAFVNEPAWPLTIIVIVQDPRLIAVMEPFAVTVAIEESDDSHITDVYDATFVLVPTAVKTFAAKVDPSIREVGTLFVAVERPLPTITVIEPVTAKVSGEVAIIFARPFEIPVIRKALFE
jgi:hypothetical protein